MSLFETLQCHRLKNNLLHNSKMQFFRKHSVMPVFDSMISCFLKVDFQKPPKHSESMWSF
jgi:hypothetical protein